VWDRGRGACNFLLLNPSTADEATNDPTSVRCERRARRWGFGGLIVTNLFAPCATDPAGLRRVADPIGPENDAVILETAQGCNRALERTVLLKGGLQPPRTVQGPKPFSNGLAPRSPATRARISSKAADPAESQGKAADWRCIRARFPVRNQVLY
jgi:Protein of unknown function (DUF1643)